MLSYLLIGMVSGSETTRWSDLAMHRDSESDSEESLSSDSSLRKVLEHAGEQSLSPSTSSSEDAAETLDLWNRIYLSHSLTVHLLMNCLVVIPSVLYMGCL